MKFLFSVPFNLNYDRHLGPVTAVAASPFNRRLFLSCSNDGQIKLFDFQNNRSVAEFEPSEKSEFIHDVAWSPIRPTVFAAVGATGRLYIYDLKENSTSPDYVIEPEDLD